MKCWNEGNTDIAGKLVLIGAKAYVMNKRGRTRLHFAAEEGDPDFERLLADGAEINVQDKFGSTPQLIAVASGNTEIIDKLLLLGAHVNIQDRSGSTCLHYAARRGDANIVEKLLLKGAIVNVKDKSKRTSLHRATEGGYLNVVEKLLAGGAGVNAMESSGSTCLHVAATLGDFHLVNKLLGEGADVNVQDNCGCTPLHYALRRGYSDIVTKLLTYGCDLEIRNKYLHTALHSAITADMFSPYQLDNSVVKMLLDNGANVNAKDSHGRTPLDVALTSRNKDECILDLRNWCAVYTNNMDRSSYENVIKWNCTPFKLQAESYTQLSYSDECWTAFRNKCICELNKMKAKKFGYLSLHDVFYRWNDPTLLSNYEMEHFLNSPTIESEFPIYAPLLKLLFVRNKQKLDMFNLLQEGGPIRLPEEVVRIIVSYNF